MKKFLKFFCFISFWVIVSNQAYADEFYSSGGDSAYCKFGINTTLSISQLPSDISFDLTNVSGDNSLDQLGRDFNHYALMSHGRTEGRGDRVSAPPGTIIDINAFVNNQSGHDIFISDIYLFTDGLSKFGASSSSIDTNYLRYGNSYNRSGLGYIIPLDQNFSPSSSSGEKGFNLTSFEIPSEVSVSDINLSYEFDSLGSLILEYSFSISNIANYDLKDVKITFLDQAQTISLGVGEDKELVFVLDEGVNYLSNYGARVIQFDLSDKQSSCTGYGGYSNEPSNRVLLIERSDVGSSQSWNAIQTDLAKPENSEVICLETIPYSFKELSPQLDLKSEIRVTKEVRELGEQWGEEVSLDPGSEFEVKVLVENSGARSDSLEISIPLDLSLMEVIDECSGTLKAGEIVWEVDKLEHGKSWECIVKLRVKDTVGSLTGELCKVSICELGQEDCKSDSVVINVVQKQDIQVEKAFEVSGDLLKFDINISNNSNGVIEDVTVKDICDGCEKFGVAQERFWHIDYLNIGLTQLSYEIDLTKVDSAVGLTNCVWLSSRNILSDEIIDCVGLSLGQENDSVIVVEELVIEDHDVLGASIDLAKGAGLAKTGGSIWEVMIVAFAVFWYYFGVYDKSKIQNSC